MAGLSDDAEDFTVQLRVSRTAEIRLN